MLYLLVICIYYVQFFFCLRTGYDRRSRERRLDELGSMDGMGPRWLQHSAVTHAFAELHKSRALVCRV